MGGGQGEDVTSSSGAGGGDITGGSGREGGKGREGKGRRWQRGGQLRAGVDLFSRRFLVVWTFFGLFNGSSWARACDRCSTRRRRTVPSWNGPGALLHIAGSPLLYGLVPPKNLKKFKISRHIVSLDVCMEY